ncbi:MvdC/MvdD family ATP grasp protein [Actinomadura harenae]|uniref:ATP-grasp ribosomal peptide maturase n=1 Tax=Actinomadura harenae TaxID=2483351 RepID=A0A3M2M119_9ACTN|nr:hypothetical protein [Actinomadura harenae]RMI43321.1 hypothetical protein EBO15_16710 [Actinomadura harenae]
MSTDRRRDTVLVVTSLEDVTADLVIAALDGRGVPVVRADPADIGAGLGFAARIGGGVTAWDGVLRTTSRALGLGRVGSVYHRRPGPWRFDSLEPRVREFAIREARPACRGCWRTLYKPARLQVAAELGFAVPATLITNEPAEAKSFAVDNAPVVYKTFRGVPPEGGHAGAIWTQRIQAGDLDASIGVTAHLYQAEIDKAADVRITVVGHRVFATAITTPDGRLDWRASDWDQLICEPFPVPADLRGLLRSHLDCFGLEFGCFDLALDHAGKLWFIEMNPNGQWGFLPDFEAIADAFAALLQAGCDP